MDRLPPRESEDTGKKQAIPASVAAELGWRRQLFSNTLKAGHLEILRSIFATAESYRDYLYSDRPLGEVLEALWKITGAETSLASNSALADLQQLKNDLANKQGYADKAFFFPKFLMMVTERRASEDPAMSRNFADILQFVTGSAEAAQKVMNEVADHYADILKHRSRGGHTPGAIPVIEG